MARAARPLFALATAALVLALAPAASAQSGNGLYEPFPKAAVDKRAKRFVDRLRFGEPLRFSDTQLKRGVFVGGAEAAQSATRGHASARAGVGQGQSDVPLAAQILLIALAIAALPLLAGRRPRRRVAPG
jgi:hypothetical protein